MTACGLRSTSRRSSARSSNSARGCSAWPRLFGMTMRNRLTRWFRRQSLARKLTTAVLLTSGVALVAASATFAAYDYSTTRARVVRDVAMVAAVLGSNSTAALAFEDNRAAGEVLRGAAVLDAIVSARLFTPDGKEIASYVRPQE